MHFARTILGTLQSAVASGAISSAFGSTRLMERNAFRPFERWLNFTEIRGGYRSIDYPFGYLELLIDPETGKGDGTFIEAAQIRWKRDKKLDQYVVEIENFGTFPARLMGISQRNS